MQKYQAVPPPGPVRKDEPDRSKAILFRAADQAVRALRLSDAVAMTLTHMIRSIPRSATMPICATAVHILAEERGVSNRTIYNHVQTLIGAELAVNRCEDGGRRVTGRINSDGEQLIAGIDFTPLFERAAEFADLVEQMEAEKAAKKRLRSQISNVRRAIRSALSRTADAPQDIVVLFEGLPRRIAELSRVQLEALLNRIEGLFRRFKATSDASSKGDKSVNYSDRSENFGRRYTSTTLSNIHICNPQIDAEKQRSAGSEGAPTCGLEHVTLPMALAVAPEDWLIRMDAYGQRDWNALTTVAYERASELGVNQTAWALAQAQIGRSGAALLILLADVNGVERGGFVRKPGAWVRAMAERAEAGTARLHASVFGILNRERSTP